MTTVLIIKMLIKIIASMIMIMPRVLITVRITYDNLDYPVNNYHKCHFNNDNEYNGNCKDNDCYNGNFNDNYSNSGSNDNIKL